MSDYQKFYALGLVPLASGLAWLSAGVMAGPLGFFLALVPGAIGIASGVALFLWQGDRRILHFASLGAVIGVASAIPGLWVLGPMEALLLALLSAAAMIATGRASLDLGSLVPGVPEPERSLAMAFKVAVDETLMAHLQLSLRYPSTKRAEIIAKEIAEARALFEEQGWLEKPLDFHQVPPSLLDPVIRKERSRGFVYEHLEFESGFEPRPEVPGAARWQEYQANRTAHAWVLRHPGPARPWLVCVNGYRMGFPFADFQAFDPRVYHQEYGLNLVFPVLPLHGRRRVGRQSGDRFLDGNLIDTVHAETQAMWDMRRVLSWVRREGAIRLGVYGLSLGGYNASLLSCVEEGLSCVIAGVPLTDIPGIYWHHGSPPRVRELERMGLDLAGLEDVFSVVSPLRLDSRVSRDSRMIFGAIGDRVVPAEQVAALSAHWGSPRTVWYQGGHVSFPFVPEVSEGIHQTLAQSRLLA